MIGFNHAAVGGLIGSFMPLPLAVPAAAASHFVLDTLPHYGIPHHKRDDSQFWRIFCALDIVATVALCVFLLAQQQYAIFACAMSAVAPDFVWVAHVLRTRSFVLDLDKNRYTRWHSRIQLFERPWGVYIELVIAAALTFVYAA